MRPDLAPLEQWLARWDLILESEPFFMSVTGSWLAPVVMDGRQAMLKIAGGEEERRGGALMAWWAGRGAAEVLAHEGEALLMARATGRGDLATLARTDDGAAAAILCDCASELHALSGDPPPSLVPLSRWFAALGPAASAHGGVLAQARTVAERLLATPDPPVVLHGDIHHGNVLDFGSDGWRVIDPKGLWGDRAFDYANLFCNPDPSIALAAGRLQHLAPRVAAHAGLAPRRLLSWVLAYAGLSAAWTLAGGGEPTTALGVARRAAAALELPAS